MQKDNVVPFNRDKKPEQPEVTVCTRCVHFVNREPGSVREDMWYNHLCKATPLPVRIDPYDGKEKHYSTNDLGKEVFSRDEFQYCREVNDGQCPKFKSHYEHPKDCNDHA